MFRPVGTDREISHLRRGSFVGGRGARVTTRWQLSILAPAVLITWLTVTFFAGTAGAGETNVSIDNFSALRDYAQLIGTPRNTAGVSEQKSGDSASTELTDATITALREFAQQIAPAQTDTIKSLPKLADADNLLDFLRERGASPPSSATPKTPAKNSGPIAGGTNQALLSKPALSAQKFASLAMRARPIRSATH